MSTPTIPTFIVNSSTSIVLIDSSQIQANSYALVYLSNVEYPGTIVTVRDYKGYASPTKQILLSTTQGLTFQDGSFSTLINQPFGFVTCSSAPPTTWQLLNTYAFANLSDAAYVRNFNADVFYTSTIQATSGGFFSAISVGTTLFVGGSLSTFGSTTLAGAVTMGSDAFIRGTLTVNGATNFTGPPSMNGDLTVHQSTFLNGNVTLSSFALFSSFSTVGNAAITGTLTVNGYTTISSFSSLGNAAILGTLTVNQFARLSSFSTLGNAAITGGLTVNGPFSTLGDATITGALTAKSLLLNSLSSISSIWIGGTLSAMGNTSIAGSLSTTGNAWIGGVLIASNGISTGSIFVNGTISTTQSIYTGGTITTSQTITASGSITANGGITIPSGQTITGQGFTTSVAAATATTLVDPVFHSLTLSDSSGVYDIRITTDGNIQSYVSGTTTPYTLHLNSNTTPEVGPGQVITGGDLSVHGIVTTDGNLYVNGEMLAVQNGASIGKITYPQLGVSLDVSGSIVASGDITAFSDARLKTNISTIGNALERLNKLRGIYYSPLNAPSTQKIGILAQELEAQFPELVHTDASNEGLKSVAYGNITAVLIEGINTLTRRVSALETTVSNIQASRAEASKAQVSKAQ